ncbi:hypothetical protein [Cellulomonas bogoriensis]
MLVAAVVIPDTPALVPGVAGRADPVAQVRTRAVDAVRRALAHDPHHVLVLAGTPREPTSLTGPDGLRADLVPSGVPARAVPATWRARPDLPGSHEPAALGALALLAHAGWDGPTTLRTCATRAPTGAVPAAPTTSGPAPADPTRGRSRVVVVLAVGDRDGADDPSRRTWDQVRAGTGLTPTGPAVHGVELWSDPA